MTANNRHPVDQLAEVRAQIKVLTELEASLKDAVSTLMGAGDFVEGDEYVAMQSISERKGSIDDKAMKLAGINADDFRKAPVTVYSLKTSPKTAQKAAA